MKPPAHHPAPHQPSEHSVSEHVQAPVGSGPKSQPNHSAGPVVSTIILVAIAVAAAFTVAGFGFQSYEVDGQSMENTLQNQDRLIVDKVPRTWSRLTHHAYIPKRGDIIVFNQPGLFDANGLAEKQLIKRVIGLPGDHVVVANGKVTIYNSQHPNGYDPDYVGGYTINEPTTLNADITLQAGQLFVCGDNRPNSEDSRSFGPINANQIVGQLVLRVAPLSNAEKF